MDIVLAARADVWDVGCGFNIRKMYTNEIIIR